MRKLFFTIGALCIAFGLLLGAVHFYPRPHPNYGVSFSLKYARELGIDPKAALSALTSDLGFSHLRLMSYWDLHEPSPGAYDFSELDWQFEIAEKEGASVLLAVGQRQPRWPECHVPAWAARLETAAYEEALLNYLAAVVSRYANHPNLRGYHLENEAANRSFGKCPTFNSQLLRREFAHIKQIDSDAQITISVSNQYGIPFQEPVADRYAMSVYRQAYFELFNRQIYWNYSFVPAEWHRLRSWLIRLIHDRDTYVHELQTEPWGPRPTKYLSQAEQNRSMSPERLWENISYAKQIGPQDIYLWGGEWWYWRLSEFDDSTLWQTVRAAIN